MAKVLCIEIGCETTKICEIDGKSKKPKVYHCFEVSTPKGAIIDGYLQADELAELKDSIQITLAEKKIRTKKVIFSIFSSKIITREVLIPAVRIGQIQAVIEANISDYFPIELEEYVISHSVMKTIHESTNGEHHKTLIYAAEKKLVRAYEQFAQECGFILENIDYAGNGMFQAVRESVGEQTEMFVRVEAENTIASIITNETLVLQRIINYGIEKEPDLLISSLIRIEDFYASQGDGNIIESIHMLGKGAQNSEFVVAVGRETGVLCNRLEVLEDFNIQSKEEQAKIYSYVSCIGAGIAPVGMTTVALKGKQETDHFIASILLLILFLISGIVIVSWSVLPYMSEVKEAQELRELEETYMPAKSVYDKYMALTELYNYVDYADKLTQRPNDRLLEFFYELEEKLPSDVKVTEFKSDTEQAIISMLVVDKETAAGVINVLRAFESIVELHVTDIVEESETETGVTFTVYCMYYPVENEMSESLETAQDDSQ